MFMISKKKKKILIIALIIIFMILLLYVLFFVIEFPGLAQHHGGCDSTGLCTEPCMVQTLYTILIEGC